MLNRWQSTIVDAQGNVQPGAVLTIRHESDQSLAQVYMSPSTTQPYPLGQVPADAFGYAYFYAPGGLYRIQSVALGVDWRHVPLGDLQGMDKADLGLGTAATKDTGTGSDEVPTNSDLGTAATRDVGAGANEVPTNSDLGSAAILNAIGTAPLYGRDSILGTVSQSGGVPTGAIIEIGSNANGEYVRWADGSQICRLRIEVTDQAISNTYSGGLYQGIRDWVFPVEFSDKPSVTCSEFMWGTSASWGTVGGKPTISLVRLRGIDTVSRSAGTATNISAIAIGRWY